MHRLPISSTIYKRYNMQIISEFFSLFVTNMHKKLVNLKCFMIQNDTIGLCIRRNNDNELKCPKCNQTLVQYHMIIDT